MHAYKNDTHVYYLSLIPFDSEYQGVTLIHHYLHECIDLAKQI